MKSEVLAHCAAEVRECADKQASDQTRARLLQVADQIEAALRGDEPAAPKPKARTITPDVVSAKAAAKAGE